MSGTASSTFQHKPKLEEDYRNKNIHKHKRLQGSNVMSPKTEKFLASQTKQYNSQSFNHNQIIDYGSLMTQLAVPPSQKPQFDSPESYERGKRREEKR
mmetsp:Transcript_3256/g.5405  ORF Transcript_3256/g.5405 Transcript_3256/m.5405 type:complete len:98 (+) Transcript_3256:131-424(+)